MRLTRTATLYSEKLEPSPKELRVRPVDNLPVDLIPKFAELMRDSASNRRASLVGDIREGASLKRFPQIYSRIRHRLSSKLILLEADDSTILRRLSETRRPHSCTLILWWSFR